MGLTTPLKVGLAQCNSDANIQGNVQLLEGHLIKAFENGLDVLVLPELFLTSYGYIDTAEKSRAVALSLDDSVIQQCQTLIASYRVATVLGYVEKNDAGLPFNSIIFVCAEGKVLQNYRKTHVWGTEKNYFAAGDSLPAVFTYKAWTLGLLICYDVEFPEAVRSLALEGANAVIVPTACPVSASVVVTTILVNARAAENCLFVLYANHAGMEGTSNFSGASAIVGPDGKDIRRGSVSEPHMLTAVLNDSEYDEIRRINPYLDDRRPGLYHVYHNLVRNPNM